MTHPLDYNPRQVLAALKQSETVATVARTVAAETLSEQDCSNNSNCSGDVELLEKELALARWKYESCIGFEYRPFRRDLSPTCIAAGKKAIRELQQQIQALETQIQRLKQFDTSSSQKRLSENSEPNKTS